MTLRIAFLTPQFVTERSDRGGLASYVSRIVVALKELGHEPEVFAVVERPGVVDYQGMRVEHVVAPEKRWSKLTRKVAYRLLGWNVNATLKHLRGAAALAKALERRSRDRPFDLVQSSSYGLTGMFVKRRPGRRHVMRCASSTFVWRSADGAEGTGDIRILDWLEARSMRRADVVYAPSGFLADRLRDRHGIDVQVVRPPSALEAEPAEILPYELPGRYLMHFGYIGPRKGSDVLAEALCLAWRQAPDLCMVWAGRELPAGEMAKYRRIWAHRAGQVYWVAQVPKAHVYGLLQRAEATVVPSRVDNLPNTAIESLALGVPVIGSEGASIDELVEPGVNGELVPIGDAPALADALVRTWRRDTSWSKENFALPVVFDEMQPAVAAKRLLEAVGFRDESYSRPPAGRTLEGVRT